ncbi:MAG: hypothetical protein LBV74_19335 [Tannerella sp.]|jgi:hypothetical protein|nr:hypothetical protein [Tannerella sp.]
MKKFLFLALVAMSLNASATSGKVNGNDRIHKYEYHKPYFKGNISPENLPQMITKYLKKNYPNYEVMVSKKKNNGNYFVKIRYQGNHSHSYYRSLVFNNNGKLIKG